MCFVHTHIPKRALQILGDLGAGVPEEGGFSGESDVIPCDTLGISPNVYGKKHRDWEQFLVSPTMPFSPFFSPTAQIIKGRGLRRGHFLLPGGKPQA